MRTGSIAYDAKVRIKQYAPAIRKFRTLFRLKVYSGWGLPNEDPLFRPLKLARFSISFDTRPNSLNSRTGRCGFFYNDARKNRAYGPSEIEQEEDKVSDLIQGEVLNSNCGSSKHCRSFYPTLPEFFVTL